jgi:hypothetical protein
MKQPNPQPLPFTTMKPYKPAPHPQQHRLTEYRSIPSLWFGKIVESKA